MSSLPSAAPLSGAAPPAAVVAAFEQAAVDTQVPATRVAGEAALAALSARADAVDLALAVVLVTSSPIARYHAAAALRAAALARWDALPAAARYGPADALRVRLVAFAVERPLHAMERGALLYAAAAFTRRAYLEEGRESRRAFLAVVCGAAREVESGGERCVAALDMLALLVGEFGMDGKGVEKDRLAQARDSFAGEGGELFLVFEAACDALKRLVGAGGGGEAIGRGDGGANLGYGGTVTSVLGRRALTVVADVLAFRSATSGFGVVYSINRGVEWEPVLTQLPALVPCLWRLFDSMRGGGEEGEAELRSALHEALCAVTAISRKSYASKELADAVLFTMLRCVQEREWLDERCATFDEDRLLYGELWRRAVAAHGLAAVFSSAPRILDAFGANTVALLRAGGRGDADDADLSAECDCMLLDTWVGLTLQAEALGNAAALRGHAASIVAEFVGKSLLSLAQEGTSGGGGGAGVGGGQGEEEPEEDFGFDDESHELAQLDAAATLCRFAPEATLARLASLLDDLSKRVFLCVRAGPLSAAGVAALHRAQDDFVWVLRLAGMALADDGAGEQPEVPSFCLQQTHEGVASVANLLGAVFSSGELDTNTLQERVGGGGGGHVRGVGDSSGVSGCNGSGGIGVEGSEVSPRVEMVILQTLGRIAKTYLLPGDEGQERAATHCVGGDEVAKRARAMCLGKAIFGVCERLFEPDVAEAATELMLVLAPGRSSGRYAELGDDARWDPLPSFGLDRFKPLETSAIEKVGTCLAHFYGNMVVERVVKPANAALHGLSVQQSSLADASEQAVVALGLLAGVAQCTQAATVAHGPLVSALRSPEGGAFIATRNFARSNIAVPVAVIKFAQDVVACHMPLLSDAAASACFKDCVALVSETVKAVLEHSSEVACEDAVSVVFVLLTLLHRLQELHSSSDTSEAAFFGLGVVRALTTNAIMTYPGVKAKYFSLVMLLVCERPEHVPNLPAEFAGKVLQSVQEGCHEVEARNSYEAVSAIASFRARHPELQGVHMAALSVVDNALEKFMALILEGVMLGGGLFGNAFDAAADALLPLLLCGGRTANIFEQAGRSLVQRSGSNEASAVAALASVSAAVQEAGPVLGYAGKGLEGVPAVRQHARETFRSRVRDLASTARLVIAQSTPEACCV